MVDHILGRVIWALLLILCARQGALTWRCKSSIHPTGGSISRTAGSEDSEVSIVRCWLKEAAGR